MPTRQEVLADSIASRTQEVLLYDINIDNYTRSIADIDATYTGDDAVSVAMRADKDKLVALLQSEKVEREKAATYLRAAQAQLDALNAGS